MKFVKQSSRGGKLHKKYTTLTAAQEKLPECYEYQLCVSLSYVTFFSFKNFTPILQMTKLTHRSEMACPSTGR